MSRIVHKIPVGGLHMAREDTEWAQSLCEAHYPRSFLPNKVAINILINIRVCHFQSLIPRNAQKVSG